MNDEQVRQAYRSFAETEAGRLIIEDLEVQGFYRTTTATMEHHLIYVNEGRRQLVLYIKEMMQPNKTLHIEHEEEELFYE